MDNNIRELRRDKGLSIAALSKRSGINKGRLSEIERGIRDLYNDECTALKNALGVDHIDMYVKVPVEPRKR